MNSVELQQAQMRFMENMFRQLCDLNFVSDDSSDDVGAACDVLSFLNSINQDGGNDEALKAFIETPMSDYPDNFPDVLKGYTDIVLSAVIGTDGVCNELIQAYNEVHHDVV